MNLHQDDLSNKVMVLQAFGSSIQTLLGPSKSLKCYLSSDPDESAIFGDTMLVLEALSTSSDHPVGQLLYECCWEQQKSCGCGVTSLVCLCSYWASEILSLVNMDVPLPIVFAIFDELLLHCNAVFRTLTISVEKLKQTPTVSQPARNQPTSSASDSVTKESAIKQFSVKHPPLHSRAAKALSLSRHFSGVAQQRGEQPHTREKERLREEKMDTLKVLEQISSKLAHGKDLAMQLAVKVIQLQQIASKDEESFKIETNLVFHHCVVGRDQNESEIISGLIAKVDPDMVALLKPLAGKESRILVVNGDCTPTWKHMGLQRVDHVMSHDPRQLYESSNKAIWLKKCAQVLKNLQINVVIVGGMVSPLLWEHCLAVGILVLSKFTGQEIDGICRLSKAISVSYITYCSDRHIGCVELEMRMDYEQLRASECKFKSLSSHCSLATAVLHGRTKTVADTLRYQFNNSLHRLKNILKDAHLLPGGGRTEAHCIHSILQLMKQQKTESLPSNRWPMLPALLSHECSWMSGQNLAREWWFAVCDAFVNGLKRYMVQVELNCHSTGEGYFVAMTTVESQIGSCDIKGEVLPWKLNVFDVERSKWESWKRAVQLLRMVFLTANLKQSST